MSFIFSDVKIIFIFLIHSSNVVLKINGSSPAYVSNHNFCVQSKYLCPITVYVSNQNLCVQSKIFVSNRKKTKKKIGKNNLT